MPTPTRSLPAAGVPDLPGEPDVANAGHLFTVGELPAGLSVLTCAPPMPAPICSLAAAAGEGELVRALGAVVGLGARSWSLAASTVVASTCWARSGAWDPPVASFLSMKARRRTIVVGATVWCDPAGCRASVSSDPLPPNTCPRVAMCQSFTALVWCTRLNVHASSLARRYVHASSLVCTHRV